MKTRDIFKFIKEKLAANKGKRISVRDVAKVGVAKMADFPYKERTLVDYIERFNAGGSINLVWGDKEVARAGIIEFIDEFNWVIDFDEYECIDPVDNNETVNEPYNQSESNEESKGSISSASLSGDVVLDDSINRGHDSTSVVNYIGDIIEDEYGRARQDRAEDKSTSLGVDNTLGDSRDVNDNNSVNDDEHRGEVNSDVHNNCNRFTGIRNNEADIDESRREGNGGMHANFMGSNNDDDIDENRREVNSEVPNSCIESSSDVHNDCIGSSIKNNDDDIDERINKKDMECVNSHEGNDVDDDSSGIGNGDSVVSNCVETVYTGVDSSADNDIVSSNDEGDEVLGNDLRYIDGDIDGTRSSSGVCDGALPGNDSNGHGDEDTVIDITTAVDATKWEYKGERYSWTSNKGLITIAGDKLDEIFFSYSKYGLNWSRSKVCRKLGISPRTFRSLAMVFFLSKDSNIYAPHISNTLDAKELDEYVTKKLDAVYKSGERIEVKYSASLQRAKQAEVDKLSIADLNMKDFLGELAEGVKVLEKTVHIKSAPEAGEDEIVVALSDLHIGAVVHNVLRTRDYTTEILEEYLTQTAEQANEKKAKKVTVVIAGDILAGGPLNHPNSFKSMDMASLHGYQTILANNVLMRFFNKINNLKSIVISGGNHSRSTSSNKEDTESTMAAVIAYFLKETYKDKIEVLYHYDVVDFSAMGMHFIVFHGDRGFHKRDISEIILYHGDPTKYNVLISGHYHSLKVQDKSDTSRYIKMTLPSIYTGDEYSASLGFSSLPGFVIIEQGRVNSKVADLQVIRL